MQGHLWDATSAIISGNTTRAEATLDGSHEVLERFSVLDRPIRITEYDFGSPDEEKKARKLRDFYRLFFSKPYVAGITMWGFWQGRHWRPDAHLWDRAWNPLPAARAYIDLVWKEWRTDTIATVPASGVLELRGFFGDYEITLGATSHPASLRKAQGGLRMDAGGRVSTWLTRSVQGPGRKARLRLFPGGLGIAIRSGWVDVRGRPLRPAGP